MGFTLRKRFLTESLYFRLCPFWGPCPAEYCSSPSARALAFCGGPRLVSLLLDILVAPYTITHCKLITMNEKIVPIGEKFSQECPHGESLTFKSRGKNPQYSDVSIAVSHCMEATNGQLHGPVNCQRSKESCAMWGKRVRIQIGETLKSVDLFVGQT